MVPRARDPNRGEAKRMYEEDGLSVRQISEDLSVPYGTVRGWKSKDKWSGTEANGTKDAPIEKEPVEIAPDNGLNDRQQMFCFFYIKYWNATAAYQEAYKCSYKTAMENGSRLTRNVKVKAEISRLKAEIREGFMLEAGMVLQKWIDIAFADIGRYLKFGQEEVEDGNGGKKMINKLRLKESEELDVSLIVNITEGREGVNIKLPDKIKALEFLSDYYDLLDEKTQKQLQQEKLKWDIEVQKGKAW